MIKQALMLCSSRNFPAEVLNFRLPGRQKLAKVLSNHIRHTQPPLIYKPNSGKTIWGKQRHHTCYLTPLLYLQTYLNLQWNRQKHNAVVCEYIPSLHHVCWTTDTSWSLGRWMCPEFTSGRRSEMFWAPRWINDIIIRCFVQPINLSFLDIYILGYNRSVKVVGTTRIRKAVLQT